MTAEQIRIATQLVRQLNRLAEIAGENNLELTNGGDVGSMLGGIAVDLEDMASKAKAQPESAPPATTKIACPHCKAAPPAYVKPTQRWQWLAQHMHACSAPRRA